MATALSSAALAAALGEVDKCALGCRHFAENADHMLADEDVAEPDGARELIDGSVGNQWVGDNLPERDDTWWRAYRDGLERVAMEAGGSALQGLGRAVRRMIARNFNTTPARLFEAAKAGDGNAIESLVRLDSRFGQRLSAQPGVEEIRSFDERRSRQARRQTQDAILDLTVLGDEDNQRQGERHREDEALVLEGLDGLQPVALIDPLVAPHVQLLDVDGVDAEVLRVVARGQPAHRVRDDDQWFVRVRAAGRFSQVIEDCAHDRSR